MKESRELEEWFGSTFTYLILSGNFGSIRDMKNEILELDKKKDADRCLEKAPMVAEVSRQNGWAQLWDSSLDLGWKTVKGLRQLSRALSHHGRGSCPCHLCDATTLPELAVLDHILVSNGEEFHLDPALDYKKLMDLLGKLHLDVLSKFSNIFITY